MRIVATIVLVITLCVLSYFGYCYYGAQMEIIEVSSLLTPAVNAPDAFAELTHELENESFLGRKFQSEPSISAPEEYAFLTLTVRLQNKGLLPQDYIEIAVQGKMGDVVQLRAERTPTLSARTRADFSATLLVPADSEPARGLRVTYYVLGRPCEVWYWP